ncbi:MAG: acylneuraminate cytidylyltransferase family protein [Oxalobacter sp.]|nr:MAG: acylneuraminate cytidylyltransferase family protein [Oxalobacter sp.]
MAKGKFGEVLALIPARGGSKSVPHKNIIPLLGKPMIAWAIEHALASEHVTRIVVTTDDEEIAAVARQYGAEVPFMRPANLAQDLSLDIEFHRHAVEWLQQHENYIPDMVINLRPTPPSRQSAVIDKAIETFAAHPDVDSLRSVHLAEQSPFKMWTIDERGYMRPIASLPDVLEPYNQPRQKLPLVYWQDGYIDITRPSVILKQNSTTGRVILPFIIEEPAADIDYPDEVGEAEAQLRERQPSKQQSNAIAPSTTLRHPS